MQPNDQTTREVLRLAESLVNTPKIEDTPSNRQMIHFYLSYLLKATRHSRDVSFSRRAMKYFLKIERKIQSTPMFWGLFSSVWLNNESGVAEFLNEVQQAVRRYDRLDCSLNDRIQMCSAFFPPKDSAETSIIELPEQITAYRGFFVRGNEDVRVNRKSKTPTAHIQEAGKGLSFTLKQSVACFFAELSTMRNGKDGGSLKRKKKFERTSAKDDFIWENYLKRGSPTIGVFSIKKEDVILFLNARKEDEILCLPEKAKLERYDILKPDQILAAFKKSAEKDPQLASYCQSLPFLNDLESSDD